MLRRRRCYSIYVYCVRNKLHSCWKSHAAIMNRHRPMIGAMNCIIWIVMITEIRRALRTRPNKRNQRWHSSQRAYFPMAYQSCQWLCTGTRRFKWIQGNALEICVYWCFAVKLWSLIKCLVVRLSKSIQLYNTIPIIRELSLILIFL